MSVKSTSRYTAKMQAIKILLRHSKPGAAYAAPGNTKILPYEPPSKGGDFIFALPKQSCKIRQLKTDHYAIYKPADSTRISCCVKENLVPAGRTRVESGIK